MSPATPMWAVRAAWLVPLLALPSSLWRLALGLGVPVGFHSDLARLYHGPGWITVYVLVLGLVTEALALLALGLVMTWGEVLPSKIPLIGGRAVPMLFTVAVASAGTLLLGWFALASLSAWNGPRNNGDPDAPHGVPALIMDACYAPMLFWAPIVAALTVAFVLRRHRATRVPDRDQD